MQYLPSRIPGLHSSKIPAVFFPYQCLEAEAPCLVQQSTLEGEGPPLSIFPPSAEAQLESCPIHMLTGYFLNYIF